MMAFCVSYSKRRPARQSLGRLELARGRVAKRIFRLLMNSCVLTILGSGAGVRVALAQLADTGGTPTAGNSCPAPAALLLPQSRTADGYALSTGDAAGQARDASSAAAAGHCHLGWSGLLSRGLVWEKWA